MVGCTPHCQSSPPRPKCVEEIIHWWDEMLATNIPKSRNTWFISSALWKIDAPWRPRAWILIPSGHCFLCGRAGHLDKNCRIHKARCKLCGLTSHTAEVCSLPAPSSSVKQALKKLRDKQNTLKRLQKDSVLSVSFHRAITEAQ